MSLSWIDFASVTRISYNGKYHDMSRYQQINDIPQLPLISTCQPYFYTLYTPNSKMSLSLSSRWLSHLHPLHFHNTVTAGRVIVAPSTKDSATSHPNFPNSTRANGKRMNSIVKLASQYPGTRKPVQLAWKGNGKVRVCECVPVGVRVRKTMRIDGRLNGRRDYDVGKWLIIMGERCRWGFIFLEVR